MSVKNRNKELARFLVFGAGWLGKKLADYLPNAALESKRILKGTDVESAIDKYKPQWIINAIGATGKPNVDWCEDHKPETYFANIHVPYLLAEASQNKKIKMLHLSSGCIYQGDNRGRGFDENDLPNFDGSYYSHTKAVAERLLSAYGHILTCRLRMPLDKAPDERNLLSKLLKYDRIIVTPNSITVVDDLLAVAKKLMMKNQHGVFNCVNPGAITHKQLLKIYEEESGKKLSKKYIKAKDLIVKAPRSNCVINTKKLEALGIALPPALASARKAIKNFVREEIK
ncbi:MAG: sugar nucleotide-binding protein [Candidatus Spechtbacteria bacterium]|nr:sugar nucleotide-binding protein [Candidatus Spechtbacteria bacterium]